MALDLITKNNKSLDDMVNQFVRLCYDRLPTKDRIQTLKEYCAKNPLRENE
jgi:hypothetical protein